MLAVSVGTVGYLTEKPGNVLKLYFLAKQCDSGTQFFSDLLGQRWTISRDMCCKCIAFGLAECPIEVGHIFVIGTECLTQLFLKHRKHGSFSVIYHLGPVFIPPV